MLTSTPESRYGPLAAIFAPTSPPKTSALCFSQTPSLPKITKLLMVSAGTLVGVGVKVAVLVGVGVNVGVFVGVLVGVGVKVAVLVGVGVNVGVFVDVLVGVGVKVAVLVGVGEAGTPSNDRMMMSTLVVSQM